MTNGKSAAAARQLLAERVGQASEVAAQVPPRFEDLDERRLGIPRCLVTTGIGTSEAHARHLAEAASRWADLPARFVPTGSLASGPPPGSERDWLIVFSQGLSANARFALADPDCWGGVVLLTGLPRPQAPGFLELDSEKAEWLIAFWDAGGIQIDLGCGGEYGLLLRVIGARVGYAASWSLIRSVLARQLQSPGHFDLDPVEFRIAQDRAVSNARSLFADASEVAKFFDPDRALLVVGENGSHVWAEHLALKISEGMLRPAPRMLDALEFTHGPLQSLGERPASILYLKNATSSPNAADFLGRFRQTLDPERHDLRVLRAELVAPFAILEYEAMLDVLILGWLEESGDDLSDWPGREREGALYGLGPATLPQPQHSAAPAKVLDEAVWSEIEAAIESGCRTAILGLGSIEQHGPHLPMATDAWIAEALARNLAARFDEAWALPALPLGCAREHLAFPGTLHLEPETLERVLVDIIHSLHHHGFDRVFVFTAHGGNVDALDAMRDRLCQSAGLDLVIDTNLAKVAGMQAEATLSAGLDSFAAGPHAGEFETSVVAALRPGSIRQRELAAGTIVSPESAQELFYPSLRERVGTGVIGDPRGASADRGERYLAAWADLLEASMRAAFARPGEKKRQ